jgi:hypothetical protein
MDAEDKERRLAETRFAAELRGQFEGLAARARHPRRRRRLVVIAVAASVAVAALVGGAALAGAFSSDSPALWPQPPLPAKSVYPLNAAGDTYGPDKPLVEEPDLVKVLATNGRQGYCLRSELEGDKTPPTMRREAEERSKRSLRGYTIPVYEADGVTQIGVFRIGGPGSMISGGSPDGGTMTRTADADLNIITTTEHPDGTVTVETEALDGTVTTKTYADKADVPPIEVPKIRVTVSPVPKTDEPPTWLLDAMSSLVRQAGATHATARWELQSRYYLKGIEGESWPESPYAQWATVWLVIMNGDFPGDAWRYWLLDQDSHLVVSSGLSNKPFPLSHDIAPMQGPIRLGEK